MGNAVLVVYALLMAVGGVMGYVKGGSRPSLIAGLVSAVLLAIAWVVARSNPVAGWTTGAVIAVGLAVVFGMRLAKTGKMMPSGGLLAVSVIAAILLAWAAYRGPRG